MMEGEKLQVPVFHIGVSGPRVHSREGCEEGNFVIVYREQTNGLLILRTEGENKQGEGRYNMCFIVIRN